MTQEGPEDEDANKQNLLRFLPRLAEQQGVSFDFLMQRIKKYDFACVVYHVHTVTCAGVWHTAVQLLRR